MTPDCILFLPFFLFVGAVMLASSLEADSTEGLAYMHDRGIIHCDVKLANTLICRADGPGGFVGKLTDPGVWLGERPDSVEYAKSLSVFFC